ncbi:MULTISPECIES: hypothetical protein [Synergistales]|nr:hypothetical protein [Aminithiophilus ramosus]
MDRSEKVIALIDRTASVMETADDLRRLTERFVVDGEKGGLVPLR